MKKNSLFVGTLFVLLQLLVIAVFVPSTWVQYVAKLEYQWVLNAYSTGTVAWLDLKASAWHEAIVFESGLADFMAKVFLPPEDMSMEGMGQLGQRLWFPFIESRGVVLSDLVQIIVYRVLTIIIWLPLIVIVTIPAALDGIVERKIKQHTFKYPSPMLYRYGAKISAIVGGLLILSFISPIPTPPIALPISIIFVVATLGLIVVGNMPKRL